MLFQKPDDRARTSWTERVLQFRNAIANHHLAVKVCEWLFTDVTLV
jgi:hypothetical protein